MIRLFLINSINILSIDMNFLIKKNLRTNDQNCKYNNTCF